MNRLRTRTRYLCQVTLLLASVFALLHPRFATAQGRFVERPGIVDSTVAARVIYVYNPRFPELEIEELRVVLRSAAELTREHFGLTVETPAHIPAVHIDTLFQQVVAYRPADFDQLIGDFRNDSVDWQRVRGLLRRKIEQEKEPLASQVAFARPHLLRPPSADTLDGFVDAVAETFRARLRHWTVARLDDGHPVIGRVPGRPDLPLNEYGYWALMMKLGLDAEIVLTNQIVASVEYLPMPIHTAIRGGITGGSTEYNPASRHGASVWVSMFPYLHDDPLLAELRGGETYSREEALRLAGAMVAHELGHLVFQLGHPWSNPACLMRPAEALEFAAWVQRLDASRCLIGSSPAMTPGTTRAPIW